MTARLDHLVVVAASLDQGVAWCEATLGATPGPGGEHPLMGTHNRLLRIATVDYPCAYLEIIAVNPGADPAARRPGRRWFDMDSDALRTRIADQGPQLVHFVARVPDVHAGVAALRAQGMDRGEVAEASRMTPRGLLRWRIALRADGQRLCDGALPTLIEWGDTHPAPALPESGLRLQSLAVTHPQAAALRRAYEAIELRGVELREGLPNLCATLLTPHGRVRLESKGL
ncbi:VOC family protein [Ramlibacter tataouinensis]|uniref:Glyoxalase-like domain-containing protein n=1 Tax=Ramlibacter tataouinensis (strain ATCC BAA-407 / DSM 14655 / LMG 21543 / TTB310) TaxID=365046 RepID=F5XVN6_RAMTT|nr:VOC family protein [Ramlibacter tataouinensis]AEG91612.1 Conserved hypothetical protein [Ramlibacter tataouinensis TTB310]